MTRITFLGGLREFGRNCAMLENQHGECLLIDAGLMFPNQEMPGVNYLVPDFEIVLAKETRLQGLVLTHGHEDHVGALAALLRKLKYIRVYGSPLANTIAQRRAREHGLTGRAEFIDVQDGTRLHAGGFELEFLNITHSIPQSLAIAVHEPGGVILHTGDFRIDHSPRLGNPTNIARIRELAASPGIRVLLVDSTRAKIDGHTGSETTVSAALRTEIAAHPGRVVVATFASHLERISSLLSIAGMTGRSVALVGTSMRQNVADARLLGILDIPGGLLVEPGDAVEDSDMLLIATGSQGEPRSALRRLIDDGQLGSKDLVILSSGPIPGNELRVAAMLEAMLELGASVRHAGTHDVHVSGHASRDELVEVFSLARPRAVIPVHGDYSCLVACADLASKTGVCETLIASNGDTVQMDDAGVAVIGHKSLRDVYVDDHSWDVEEKILRERDILRDHGVILVNVRLDQQTSHHEFSCSTLGWAGVSGDQLLGLVNNELTRLPEIDPANAEMTVRTAIHRSLKLKRHQRPAVVVQVHLV